MIRWGIIHYSRNNLLMITQTIRGHVAGLAAVLAGFITLAGVALAAGPAEVTYDVNTCEPTTFSATADGSTVGNQYLVVDTEDAEEQYANIPTDGSSADISVGPFGSDTVVSWHVFGGGERNYDMPHWNGFGTPSFSSDINDYYDEVGTFNWVIQGTDDPNPFVTWNEVEVPACSPEVKNDCKKGGWEAFGFKNQGQCVRFVETGKDSR